MASIAAMPEAKANAAVPPSIAAMLASSAARVGILRARVLESLVLAELLLHVGRGLEDRRDDRAGAGIGHLSGVNADGRRSARPAGVSCSNNRTWRDAPRRGPSPRRSQVARELLFGTWSGRLFLVAASLKFVVALWRITGALPDGRACDQRRRDHRARRRASAMFVVAALRPDQAPPAVARSPQADPLLHLHRRHSVAADPGLLPVRRQPGVHERQRLPVQGRLRRDRGERAR